MTGAVLISVYLFVLALFLGNDIISKVAPTIQTALLLGLSALSGVALLAALVVSPFLVRGGAGTVVVVACGLGSAAVVGGLLAARRQLEKR